MPFICFGLFQASCGNSILQCEFVTDKQALKHNLPELFETEWLYGGVLWNDDSMAHIFTLYLPNIPDASYADDVIADRLMKNYWGRLNRKEFVKYDREWLMVSLIEKNSVLVGHVPQTLKWAKEGFWPRYEEALRILRKDPSKKNPLDLP